MQYWWLIGISVFAGVAGQTMIKLGLGPQKSTPSSGGIIAAISLIINSPFVLLGLALYVVGAFTWIMVLSRVNLSYAYPFLALNFVLITIASRFVLGESIPIVRWIGMGVICVGIVLVSLTAPR